MSTLTTIAVLASVLRGQGKYNKAEEMNRRALKGYEKVLGKQHPDTLTSVSNLALVLREQGKYKENTLERAVYFGPRYIWFREQSQIYT
ncbi:hypothetical protein F4823DRAFT_572174 [Ustulina deusta]|nr:hypothetical protein F4823DRAFT_572174 [Ustulina deusta]